MHDLTYQNIKFGNSLKEPFIVDAYDFPLKGAFLISRTKIREIRFTLLFLNFFH
jgi:hypothetical protein